MKPSLSSRFVVPVILLMMGILLLQALPGNAMVATTPLEPATPSPPGEGPWVVRAHFTNREMVAELASWKEPWQVLYDDGYLFVDVNLADYERLVAAGFQLEIDEKLTDQLQQARTRLPGQVAGIPGYPCYRTVEETYETANGMVTAHPDLAAWIDIGDSWEKVTPGESPGYDLRVLRLSNTAVPGPKPKFFLMGAIHAREYATAELVTRFTEYLLDNYSLDADVTWLLDYHEIHLLLITNPDGRKQAETGLSWRKNTNENYCSPTSTSRGADLNRNFAFQWACCGGSSGYECDSTYRGPSAASEPETQSVQDYLRAIFPDQRDAALDSAAPTDATGVFIDVHASGDLVLWPWGFDYLPAPNGTALQTLGRKFAFFNNYYPEQAADLYPTDGASDDWAYGELGVAAYTFELGNSFFQSCTIFENEIVPNNIPAFLYAASVARTPYLAPVGPDVLELDASPVTVAAGDPLLLTATIDDSRYQNSNGSEPVQNIAAAEFYIDVPSWITTTAPIPHPMTAVDGLYDEPIEAVVASVDSSALTAGRHQIFVRGQDANSNWGPVSASFLYVVEPGVSPVIQGTVLEAGTGASLTATVTAGPFETSTDPTTGTYSMTVISDTYDLRVASPDHATATVLMVSAADYETVIQDFSLYPVCPVLEDDVEAGNLGWTASGSWAITDIDAHSPTHAWTDSPSGSYGNNWDYSLTSAPLDLSEMEGVSLSFWHRYDLESNWDYATIETSLNGVTWTTIDAFTGSSAAGWTEYKVALPDLDGQNNARIRFRIVTDVNTVTDGWYIDDVTIRGGGSSCLNPVPEASFSTSSPDWLGETTTVTNTTTGNPPITYNWDFGDGSPGVVGISPSHAYSAAGVYQITLTATNSAGTDVAQRELMVYSAGVELGSATGDSGEGDPGSTVTYTLQVTNTGTYTNSYQIMVENSSWTNSFAPSTLLDLAPDSAADLNVYVEIDPAALVGAEDIATVQVTDGLISATAHLTTTANPLYQSSLSPPSADGTGDPGTTVSYAMEAYNSGNITDTLWFEAVGLWPLYLDPTTPFSLPPGASQELTVTVSIPVGTPIGSHDTTTVTLHAEGQAETGETSLLSTFSGCMPVSGLEIALTPHTVHPGELITLTGTVAAGTQPITYTWDFGDSSDSQVGSPVTHTFPITVNPVVYTVTLTADNACLGPATHSMAIIAGPYTLYLPLALD